MSSENILDRLKRGEVIIGDGSYVNTLEKRGYVKAGNYTPEASVEHPEVVENLAIEFARAGGDITQTFTFYSRDVGTPEDVKLTCQEINQASCDIAKSVALARGTIVTGGVIQTSSYRKTKNKEEVQKELREALDILVRNDVDLILLEYFEHIEEMEWAIELGLTYGKPLAATMCIGPLGDTAGVPLSDCAVRMARAGAPIVGTNCLFDPPISLETMRRMKAALDAEGLTPYLMSQPLGYRTPEGGRRGWIQLPEFPFALEPRQVTRLEMARWAREAYNIGVRVLGGCCGVESHHIRAIAEELAAERGGMPEGSVKSDHDLKTLKKKSDLGRPEFRNKGDKAFWASMVPATGRPESPAVNQDAVKAAIASGQPSC